MSWTPEKQARLNHLRAKDLAGGLSGSERGELAALMARVEADEAGALAPALDHLRTEVGTLAQELAAVRGDHHELARLLARRQTLVADARRFLADLDQRSTAIADALGMADLVGLLQDLDLERPAQGEYEKRDSIP